MKIFSFENDKIISYICEKIHNESAYNVKKFTKNENAFMSTFGASRVEYSKEAVANEKIFIGEKFHKCKNLQKTFSKETAFKKFKNVPRGTKKEK